MSLAAETSAFTANMRKTAPLQMVETFGNEITRLKASDLAKNVLKAGQQFPDFELPDASGKVVTRTELLAKGSLLISFYRGGWCPYCNLELKALQNHLGEFESRGTTLVAISPQLPDASLSTQEKHGLKFPVLSDVGNQLARKLGIVFQLGEPVQVLSKKLGTDLPTVNGDDSYELPVPATFLVDRAGIVRNSFVDVDYRNRLEPEIALAWLDALAQ